MLERGYSEYKRKQQSCAVLRLILAGELDEALRVATARRSKVDPGMAALVQLLHGDASARERVLAAWQDEPKDNWRTSAMLMTYAHQREWSAVDAMFQEVVHSTLGATVFIIERAYRAEDFADGARIGERMVATAARRETASLIAFNTACCWARAGDPIRAFEALQHAVEIGWSDFGQIDRDDDLTTIRSLAEFPAWRAALA